MEVNTEEMIAIIDDAEPGCEISYLLYEFRNRIGYIILDQKENRYVQSMVLQAESFIDALEYFLRKERGHTNE